MTVQELIEKLQSLKDKSVPVVLLDWNNNGSVGFGPELTHNRILVQGHRLAILIN